MPFCFQIAIVAGCVTGLCLPVTAASLAKIPAAAATRSVVRVNSRGQLIRTVVVAQPVARQAASQAAPQAASPFVPEHVVDASEIRPASPLTIPELVEAAAKKYDVDPLLVHSVIQVESGYNPHAVSPKGAQGMMQLMPFTARRFGVSNIFDPRENIEGGVRYLRYLQSLFPEDLRLAIAAYNAGEGAVWKYNNQVPPYKETEHYVKRVGRKYGDARLQADRWKNEKERTADIPAEPKSSDAPAVPAEPVYAPFEAYLDGEGRLHMRTSEAALSAENKVP